MVRYINIIWLLICALAGGSVAALSTLFLAGALFSGLSKGFNYTDIFALPLLLLPLVLTIWSCLLSRDVYHSSILLQRRLRYQLFAFYCIALIVSTWASAWTATRDGLTFAMFSPETALIVGGFFLVPILSLVLASLLN